MESVAVVTGGSSGIGKATARLLHEAGYTVYELSRHGGGDAGVSHIDCDITDEAQVNAAFAQVFAERGRLDLLINNAGMGISGAVEMTALADAQRIFDVNFFGMFRATKAAIPYMRQSGGGRIVSVSSVAAIAAIPFQAFYSATKAGVSMLSLALRNELKPFGITASAVLPGDVRTGFTEARVKNDAGAAVYGDVISKAVAAMEKDERGGMQPEAVAQLIVRVAQKKRPRAWYIVGGKYKFFGFLIKILPATWANAIIGSMYG